MEEEAAAPVHSRVSIPERPSREDEAHAYLDEHNIIGILNDLTASLIFHRPDNPRAFLVEEVRKLRRVKFAKQEQLAPTLLLRPNAEAIFRTLDPTGQGFITARQCTETLTQLGVRDFDRFDEAPVPIKVTQEMFIAQFHFKD